MMDLLSFPDTSKVWIYASDKFIPDSQIESLQSFIVKFTKTWTSHSQSVKATGGVLHNYFIVLIVDEENNKPGGCSIDHSVRFIKSLESELKVDFFNRTLLYYLEDEIVKLISKDDLSEAVRSGKIKEDTLFFDTLVSSKCEFQNSWLKPLNKSWHQNLI